MLTSVLANLGWRQPLHYLIACGFIFAAEVMLLDGRWKQIGDAALKQVDEAERTEHAKRLPDPGGGAP